MFEHHDDLNQKIDLCDNRKEEGGTKRVNKEYFINPLKETRNSLCNMSKVRNKNRDTKSPRF